jgi:hypothetical protein
MAGRPVIPLPEQAHGVYVGRVYGERGARLGIGKPIVVGAHQDLRAAENERYRVAWLDRGDQRAE